jgi:catenin alpha
VLWSKVHNTKECLIICQIISAVDTQRSANVLFVSAVMPNFAQRVEVAVDALSSNPPKDVDENEFIDASRLVYDGVREIRRAVLMNRVSNNLLLHVHVNWYSEDILYIMLL